jgi:uncharacterized Zn-finger protein
VLKLSVQIGADTSQCPGVTQIYMGNVPCGAAFAGYHPRHFNPIGSIPMTTPASEVITVNKRRIACDGGGGALGHPRVYLEMGQGSEVECPYCDRKFVLSREAAEAEHH